MTPETTVAIRIYMLTSAAPVLTTANNAEPVTRTKAPPPKPLKQTRASAILSCNMVTPTVPRLGLGNTIEEVASSYIGNLMGKAASTAHFRRLGIEQERLGAEQVDAVLSSLRLSLKVLVGDRTADKVVAEIRTRVSA